MGTFELRIFFFIMILILGQSTGEESAAVFRQLSTKLGQGKELKCS